MATRSPTAFRGAALAVAALFATVACTKHENPADAVPPKVDFPSFWRAAQTEARTRGVDLLLWFNPERIRFRSQGAAQPATLEDWFRDDEHYRELSSDFLLLEVVRDTDEAETRRQLPAVLLAQRMLGWGSSGALGDPMVPRMELHMPELVLVDAAGVPFAIGPTYRAERGKEFAAELRALRGARARRDDAFARAAAASGSQRARELRAALAALDPVMVPRCHVDVLQELAALDEAGASGEVGENDRAWVREQLRWSQVFAALAVVADTMHDHDLETVDPRRACAELDRATEPYRDVPEVRQAVAGYHAILLVRQALDEADRQKLLQGLDDALALAPRSLCAAWLHTVAAHVKRRPLR